MQMNENDPLIIKKRGEDGTRIISARIKEDLLSKIDRIASETNYSRNELINTLLEYSVNRTIIK